MTYDPDWYEATFQPKRTDNIRAELKPMIGQRAKWHRVGTSGDDEPYPGQTRWMTMDMRFHLYWVPEEDLNPRPTERDGW